MEAQPVYEPHPADFERKLTEAFPNAGLRAAARSQLLRYGREAWHREIPRVRLAILKICGGDLMEIDRHVARAGEGYRDILAAAEYPSYSSLGPSATDSDRAQAAIRADRQQYLEWVSSP